jgi:uncharacterized protein YicC (UPF0701 family)
MTTINDFIEEWIQIRTTLQKQITALESGKSSEGTNVVESTIEETIDRLKSWVSELNKLLKDYSSARRT